jgi:hypothetical protein
VVIGPGVYLSLPGAGDTSNAATGAGSAYSLGPAPFPCLRLRLRFHGSFCICIYPTHPTHGGKREGYG